MQTDISALFTEGVNPDTRELDRLSTLEIVRLINREDAKVAPAVEKQLAFIALAVEGIVKRMRQGGRLIYVGAGTSGRLGVLDASECPPTYGVSEHQVMGLIAGGRAAMFKAQENVEDSPLLGQKDLENIHLSPNDAVCAVAASGRTPYCIGALAYAAAVGAFTVAVSCNPNAPICAKAQVAIVPQVGPEAVSGSTRMKAGTAQKMVLNMLSTASMVQLGKVYGNLMVDVQATNEKLGLRCQNIVMEVTGVSRPEAARALAEAGGYVKLALCMMLTGKNRAEANAALQEAGGHLRRVLEEKR